MEKEYKSIQLDKEIYDRLLALAEAAERTIKGQIAWMVKQEEEKERETK
jgi:hypothetical protein